MVRMVPLLLMLAACAPPPETAAPLAAEGSPQTTLTCAIYFAVGGRQGMSDAFAQIHARQTGRSITSITAEAIAFRDDPQRIDAAPLMEMRRICEKQVALYPETRAAR